MKIYLFHFFDVYPCSDFIYTEPCSFYRTVRNEPHIGAEAPQSLPVSHGGTKASFVPAQLHPQYADISLRRDPTIAYGSSQPQLVARRESMASAMSLLGSFASGSTFDSEIGEDAAIMSRLRKSMEQKEEFLRGGQIKQPQDALGGQSSQFGSNSTLQSGTKFDSVEKCVVHSFLFVILLYSQQLPCGIIGNSMHDPTGFRSRYGHHLKKLRNR